MNIVNLSIMVTVATTLIGICIIVGLWMKIHKMQQSRDIPPVRRDIPPVKSIHTPNWSLSKNDQEKLLYQYKQKGMTGPALAKQYKIPLYAVYYIVDRYGKYRKPGKYKHCQRRRARKITPKIAQKIAEDYTVHKIKTAQIAHKYNITPSTVYKVSKRLKKNRT